MLLLFPLNSFHQSSDSMSPDDTFLGLTCARKMDYMEIHGMETILARDQLRTQVSDVL